MTSSTEIEFTQFGEDAWVEKTKSVLRWRYQIIRRPSGIYDWHLVKGILAIASGYEPTLELAKAACNKNKAERLARRQQRAAERGNL